MRLQVSVTNCIIENICKYFKNIYVSRKSQLLSFLLCIGSIDVALGHPETEQRLLDVLQDFYKDKIFAFDDKDLFD